MIGAPDRCRLRMLRGLLVLVLLQPTTWSGAVTLGGQAAALAPLPEAEELVAAYVQALGGEQAIRRHTSMRWLGTVEMVGAGLSGDLELYRAAPDRMLMQLEIEGIGRVAQGFDGEVAWEDSPMTGPSIVSGGARDEVARNATFHAELAYAEIYPEMKTVERTVYAEQDVYKVRCVDGAGKESFHYFAVSTGLLAGMEGELESPMGVVHVTAKLGGYEEFGGRLIATERRESAMGMEQVTRVREVEFDTVEESVFELPPAIVTLLGE